MTAAVHDRKSVALALQGGGAHGAFTWGVLDRLLEEERLDIEGVSATSAGAMNAAALKSGLVGGGSRDHAKAALERFWSETERRGRGAPNPVVEWLRVVNPSPRALAEAIDLTPGHLAGEAIQRVFSPYDLNPFDMNPLRDLLAGELDFDAVCRDCLPHLFISATNVRTGKIKVFQGDQISTEAILASACLPTLFRAVEIEDPATGRMEAYWDGGYAGNPALFPLHQLATSDVLIVHINPIVREEVPRQARDIMDRVNEISFNAALLGELRAIGFVRRLIADGRLQRGEMKDVLIHSIMDDETMTQLGAATKARPDRTILAHLRAAGRAAADDFLRESWGRLGREASVDLSRLYA